MRLIVQAKSDKRKEKIPTEAEHTNQGVLQFTLAT